MEIAGKILFLDIDGVLNHADNSQGIYHDKFADTALPLDEDNVLQLQNLLNADSSLKIVWSTDWKNYENDTWQKWKNPRLHLEQQDFMKDRIAGKTPTKMSSEHFHEIHWWLKAHPDVVDYVILEDSYFPDDWFGLEKHLVRIDPEKGLTEKDVELAIEILNIKKGE